MPRVKGSTIHRARRKKVMEEAKGYFGSKHRLYKSATEIEDKRREILENYGLQELTLLVVKTKSVILNSLMVYQKLELQLTVKC